MKCASKDKYAYKKHQVSFKELEHEVLSLFSCVTSGKLFNFFMLLFLSDENNTFFIDLFQWLFEMMDLTFNRISGT